MKRVAFKPTIEQGLAINEKGSIIVSAAAGSGKTAVLVERVIKMLTDEISPIPADKLLVVTFTNAAAAELRLRIEKRLNEELSKNPQDILLQKQQILISNAKICTIDAFCIDFLKENFEKVGISPSFKIADNPTLNTFQRTALSEVVNEYFENKDNSFLNLLDFLGDDYDDSVLIKTVMSVFEFSRHMPFPRLWLNSVLEQYRQHYEGHTDEWFNLALKSVKNIAEDAYIDIKQAINILSRSDAALEKYSDNFTYFKELSQKLIAYSSENKWDDIFIAVSSVKAPPLKKLSADEKTNDVETALKLRDSAKKLISNISTAVYANKQSIISEMEYIYGFVCKISEIVCKYEDKLYDLLRENDLMTFYLAEQTVLEMLVCESNGKLVPSGDIAEYTEKYDAILVDEYQDTNTLQDTLFNVLSGNGERLFCVGDIKQCIYKFRGSNPLNFLKKKELSKNINEKSPADILRVDLGCNFRSREEICNFINSIFGKLIYNENSDFNYDENEKLVPKAVFPQNADTKVENHFLDFGEIQKNSDIIIESKLEAEAYVLTNIIEDIVNKEPFIRDGDTLRKATYGDITILVRSMQGHDQAYITALSQRGIPVAVSTSDIVDSDEVNTLLSFLKIINNPSDDIALITVLTSPVFYFSMNELAEIRAAHRYGNFYSSLLAAAKSGNQKACDFIYVISALRRRSTLLTLGVLIEEIFEETNLLNLFSSQSNGDVKRLNLLSVQNLAADFDANKNQDIKSFINYFSELKNRDFSLAADSANSVKIMSIHKSKGLQFPVCILANTTNKFNEQDLRDSVIMTENNGISLVYYDADGSKKDSFVLRTLMKFEEKRNLLAEELRLFYVALTRAEEKLITLSTYDNLLEEVERKNTNLYATGSNYRVEPSLFRKNNCYADWLLEALILDGNFDALSSKTESRQIILHDKICQTTKANNNEISEVEKSTTNDYLHLLEIYNFKYPFSDLRELQAKASVTDIVHKADEEKYRFKTRPAFMQNDGLSSSERGTAMHKVMQMADFKRCKNWLTDEVNALYENMFLSESEYESLDLKLLQSFFDSNICDRAIASNYVKKEMKFLTEFPAGELMQNISENCKDELIVVQGAVDLVFEEDGKLVIVDFKSDRNKNENELISAYEQQLKIYAKACSKLLKLPIKELIIYSFALGKEIIIK